MPDEIWGSCCEYQQMKLSHGGDIMCLGSDHAPLARDRGHSVLLLSLRTHPPPATLSPPGSPPSLSAPGP